MPHVINVLGTISCVSTLIFFLQVYRNMFKSGLTTAGAIGFRVSNMLNYWLMFRLIRVQVQLMAEKEYTKIIIKKIRRSKVIEWVMLMLLTVIIAS